MSTGNAVRRAIYGRMTGDTTLRNLVGTAPAGYNTNNKAIYSDVAPAESGTPYIVFFQTSGVPMGDTFNPRGTATENDLWTIKAVARMARPTEVTSPTNKSAQDAAEGIQDRLDTLLTDPTGGLTIAGAVPPAGVSAADWATTVYCRRESDISYSEQTDGVVYFHRGCVFRLIWC